MFNFKVVVWFATCSTLMLLFCSSCNADSNASNGWECSQADKSTSEDAFQANLNNLLNSLGAEAPLHNGFHKSREGKGSNKVYGVVQCRGDVSGPDCANCTKESISTALQDCSKSKQVKVWFTWCFLRYSDEDFLGVMDPTSGAKTNDTNFDDPSVEPRGFNLMTELATTAPKQPFMFQTVVLDAGKNGKRYGMAQCNRDISRSDCGICLSSQLTTFRTTVGNKRDWEIYGSSCSMWYHDFRFYFNFSTPTNQGESYSHVSCVMFSLFSFIR